MAIGSVALVNCAEVVLEPHPRIAATYARWIDTPRQVKRRLLPDALVARYIASGTLHVVPTAPRSKHFYCFSGFGVLASLDLLSDDLRRETSITLIRHRAPSAQEITQRGQAELDALFIEHVGGADFKGRLQGYFEDEFRLGPSAIRRITGLSQRRSKRVDEPRVLDLVSEELREQDE